MTNSAKRLFSMAEAASELGISRRHIDRLVTRGEVSTIRLGKRRLVPASEIERIVRGDVDGSDTPHRGWEFGEAGR
jgi:excisionase family DNA binding protein